MPAALPKPHPNLTQTLQETRGMEGMVAKWYTNNTGRSLDEFTDLARRIAGQLPRGSSVLEVASGPGNFSIQLAKQGKYSITGLDLSHTFVGIARRKAVEAGVHVKFEQGNAASLPFPDDRFDFLLCRAAFKNFGQPVRALQEMCRALKPGGRGLIIDLNRDATPDSMNHYVDTMGLTFVNKVVTKLVFRTKLSKTAYTRQQFQQM